MFEGHDYCNKNLNSMDFCQITGQENLSEEEDSFNSYLLLVAKIKEHPCIYINRKKKREHKNNLEDIEKSWNNIADNLNVTGNFNIIYVTAK